MLVFSGVAMAQAQTSLKLKFKKSTIFAGIEVGSKGVKMSLVEIDNKAVRAGTFNLLKDTSVNTDFISFSDALLFILISYSCSGSGSSSICIT